MPTAFPPPRRGPAERLQTWVVTGPPGHLYSVVADLTIFFVRSLYARAQRRLSGEASRPSARR